MGIFDDIKRAVDNATKPASKPPGQAPSRSRGPAPRRGEQPPALAALDAAQRRRRETGATKKNGKKATARDLRHYESLERALVLERGAFPLDVATTRAALAARGFRPEHVEAYLASDAARKLLE